MSFLILDHLVKRFPSRDAGGRETIAVDGVSLSIESGEMVTLLGPSGCGKTTTLRMIAGFEQPTEGRILLDGQEIQNLSPGRRGMAMVFQSYALFPHLSVYENVAYGLRVQKRSDAEIRQRVAEALDLVNLRGLENRSPSQLSGGQQQRVALARALVVRPRVLLFDEPLSNLDASLREQMRFQIRQLQRHLGITAVYVTHDQSEAMVLSDRMVVMDRGLIKQAGRPVEVYRRPAERFVAGFLGRANFLPARVIADGPSPRVEVHGVTFPAQFASDLPSGIDATAIIRPEALAIAPLDGQATIDGAFTGTVSQVTFLGALVEYEVALASPRGASSTLGASDGPSDTTAVTVHDHDPSRDEPLPVGTAVSVRPAGGALYILPGAA